MQQNGCPQSPDNRRQAPRRQTGNLRARFGLFIHLFERTGDFEIR